MWIQYFLVFSLEFSKCNMFNIHSISIIYFAVGNKDKGVRNPPSESHIPLADSSRVLIPPQINNCKMQISRASY